jgi:hypothetical protein
MNINVTPGEWTLVPIGKAGIIKHRSGNGKVVYCQFMGEPSTDVKSVALLGDTALGGAVHVDGVLDGQEVYALALSSPVVISATPLDSAAVPTGIYTGIRAVNVQFYSESNAKLGSQWEISRELTAASGQRIFSVLRVGTEFPVDLKARGFSATGSGVVGKVYFLNPEDIESFGTPDKWYNSRKDLAKLGVQPDTQIYPISEIAFAGGLSATDFAVEARKITADVSAWGADSFFAGGVSSGNFGGNQIFEPNYIALFETLSRSAQTIGSSLTIYEGPLDLPIN